MQRWYEINDRVHHVLIGDGTVSAVDGDTVTVVFDLWRNGHQAVGIFDRRWFALNPSYLYRIDPDNER